MCWPRRSRPPSRPGGAAANARAGARGAGRHGPAAGRKPDARACAGPADSVRHRRRAGGAGVSAQANDQGQPHDPPGIAGAGRAGARAGRGGAGLSGRRVPPRSRRRRKWPPRKAAIFTTASQRLRACAGTPACRPTRPTRRRRNPPGRSPAALRAWRPCAGWRSAPSGRAPAWRGS